MLEVRRQKIVDIINDKGSVAISELASEFNTSEMTIHRDLDFLESKGLLKKKRGGAIANTFSETFRKRATKNLEKKQEVAQKAYGLLENYDTVLIDGGTTSLEVVRLMKGKKKLTVFTNSILSLYELRDAANITLYCLGSCYARDMVHFVGADVEKRIESLSVSKCIIGTAGISGDLIFFDPYPQLASSKRKMIEASATAILVADSSKFGTVAVQRFATAGDISYLVTDGDVPHEFRNKPQLDKGKLIY